MNAPIRKKQQKFLLKTLIVCILLYILFLLSSIFLGTGLKKNASRAVKDMTSFLACSIFQNDSATISYCLDPNRKDVTKQLLTNALYSPVIQYVQPSSEHSSHYQLSNSIRILISAGQSGKLLNIAYENIHIAIHLSIQTNTITHLKI